MWFARGIHKAPPSTLERLDSRMQRVAKNSRQPLPPFEHIVQIGDPVLRTKAEEVPLGEIKSPFVQTLVAKLLTTLKKYDSVGVSAPQIGTPLSVFVVGLSKSQIKSWSTETAAKRGMELIDPPRVVINPTLEVTDASTVTFPEGCCSFYGFSAHVPRFRKVLLRGYDVEGKELEWPASDWTARILQHEMDHLRGKLFIDPPTETSTLEFNYWESVNKREGDFKLPYSGIGISHRFFPFKLFFRKK